MRRLLLLASAIVFVDTTFYAAITPLLPGFEEEYGLGKSGAGVLAAAYPAGTFVGALPGGYLAARAGVRATVLLGLGLMSVSSVAFAFGDSILVLDIARFAQGVGGAASWAGAMAWVATAAPRDRRGEMLGTTMAAAVGGALLGPVIGALADVLGVTPVFCGAALAGLALALWALTMPPPAPEGTSSPRELLGALRDGRIAFGIWLIAVPGLIFGTIAVLGPLRLDEFGVGATAIAAVWLGAAALEAGVSPVAGRLSDRRGRLFPALIGLAAAGLLLPLFALAEHAWQLALLILVMAPLVGILWAPSLALLADGAEALGIAQGLAFALSNLGWSLGQTLGNAGMARVAEATSDTVPYVALSAISLATIAVIARARRPAAVA